MANKAAELELLRLKVSLHHVGGQWASAHETCITMWSQPKGSVVLPSNESMEAELTKVKLEAVKEQAETALLRQELAAVKASIRYISRCAFEPVSTRCCRSRTYSCNSKTPWRRACTHHLKDTDAHANGNAASRVSIAHCPLASSPLSETILFHCEPMCMAMTMTSHSCTVKLLKLSLCHSMQFLLQDASSLHNKTSADTVNFHDNCTDLLKGKLEQLRTLAKRTAFKIKHEQQETDKMLEQASREFGPPLGSANLMEAFYSSQGKHSDLHSLILSFMDSLAVLRVSTQISYNWHSPILSWDHCKPHANNFTSSMTPSTYVSCELSIVFKVVAML